MDSLLQDIRFAIRTLLKSPGFTIVAIATLALGIGANSAIFSVVDAVLIEPLPYREPGRLVVLNHFYPALPLNASVSAAGYSHYRDTARSLENLAAFGGWSANFTGDAEPERLRGVVVTSNFFETLGVEAAQGRTFARDEMQAGKDQVVVLSHAFWQRRFGGRSDVVGQTLTINGKNYSVVGIMPQRFRFGRERANEIEIYSPIVFTPQQLSPQAWTNEFLQVVGRLKTGATLEQAQSEMDAIVKDLEKQFGRESPFRLPLRYYTETIVGDIRPALLILLGAVGFVLLIACANVANLLLARAAGREREIAIRSTVGAGWNRIVRQLLTEGLVLSFVGGVAGLLLAYWGVRSLPAITQNTLPQAADLQIQSRVLLFTFVIAAVTGTVFGLVPALRAAKKDFQNALKEGGRPVAGSGRRLRGALVVSEIAIALILLVGAGLLIESFRRVQEVNPGFRAENLLVMQISLPGFRYGDAQAVRTFYDQTLESVRAIPGVVSAAAISSLPLSGTVQSGSFQIEGRQQQPGQPFPHGDRWVASERYFETMQIPLREGRLFNQLDRSDSPPVVIVDEALARKYWPDESALGKRIMVNGTTREIIGIVGHVRHLSLDGTEDRVQYYGNLQQNPASGSYIVVRTSRDAVGMASSVRAAIRSVDKDLPVFRVTDMEEMVANSLSQRRLSTVLLAIFAFVAIALSTIGLYGLISYSVTQRTHEIGIRIAIGAARGDVMRMVMGQGMMLVGFGLVAGLVGAFALTRLMTTLLFGVSATDPFIFAVVCGVLLIAAMAAAWIPARRAVRIDPIIALRYE
jgi:putative ABC transport system permease protein